MKDFLLFWGLILLLGIILLYGVPYLIFIVLKKLGKPKIGKIIGIVISTFFTFFTIYVVFEDYFFFKSSAHYELNQIDLVLNDDFEIIKNESGRFSDFYHIFELKISEQDVNRLTKNTKSKTKLITIYKKSIKDNIWKEVKIDKKKKLLIYEYIIN